MSSHRHGCSITGGYVYRGNDYPAIVGQYVFSDYCSGTIRTVAAGGPDAGGDPSVVL